MRLPYQTLRELTCAALQDLLAIFSLLRPLADKLAEYRGTINGDTNEDVNESSNSSAFAEARVYLRVEEADKYVEEVLTIFRKLWRGTDENGARALQQRLELAKRYERKLHMFLQSRVEGFRDSKDKDDMQFSLDFVDKIKSALYFREESNRFVEVKEAHRETFRWIFEDHVAGQSALSEEARDSVQQFRPWLRKGKGCFWFNGKAGSGKSTLMKYIFHHKSLVDDLKVWAGPRQLIACRFFFWYAGKPLQRSQEGVLRSILFNILNVRPSLTPLLFPRLSQYVLCKGKNAEINVSPQELHEALELLARNVPDDLAIFMLVDGIDEYTGDHFDFSKFLVGVSQRSSAIKLLVSSRPIPACHQIFSQFPTLRLQDLTAGDIRAYVEHELIRNPLFIEMNVLERGFAEEIRTSLTEKSSGVFLWIVLVVRRLLIGLGNYENKTRLLEIIDELPNDLMNLYDHMFSTMSVEHQREGSTLFQLTVRARAAQPCPLTAVQLLAAFQGGSLPDPSSTCDQAASNDELLRVLVKAMDGKLRSRCCGLVEVQYADIHGALKHPKVDFLHRTVYDYLSDSEVWQKVADVHELSSADVDLMLLTGCAYEVRRRALSRTPKGQTLELPLEYFTASLIYSDQLNVENDERYISYLEQADDSFVSASKLAIAPLMLYQQACQSFANHRNYEWPYEQTNFTPGADIELGTTLAIAKLGFPAYLERRLCTRNLDGPTKALLLLYTLVLVKVSSIETKLAKRYEANIHILLRHATDPNVSLQYTEETIAPLLLRCAKAKEYYRARSLTPWQFWLVEQKQTLTHLQITLSLVRAGAMNVENSNPERLATQSLCDKLDAYKAEVAGNRDEREVLEEILSKLRPANRSCLTLPLDTKRIAGKKSSSSSRITSLQPRMNSTHSTHSNTESEDESPQIPAQNREQRKDQSSSSFDLPWNMDPTAARLSEPEERSAREHSTEDYLSRLFNQALPEHKPQMFRLDGTVYGLEPQQRKRRKVSSFSKWLRKVFGSNKPP